MTHFILQFVFFQLVFLLAYDFFLKKETFFSYNRWYLLITPLLSLGLPFLAFDLLAEMAPAGSTVLLPEVFIGAAPQKATSVDVETVASGFQINWWWIVYFSGFLINLFLFFRKYRMLAKLKKDAIISEEKSWKIVEVPDSNLAFTFYRTIFLGDRLSETERQQVLSHELVHVRQKHTLDLLFFEFQKIIFWFNPLVYIFQAKITDLHEFIADARAVKTTGKKEYYQQLLNAAFGTQDISFINQFFNHSSTGLTVFGKTFTFGKFDGQVKKRIVMLQKSKSKTIAKLKYLILVPLMLMMLIFVACSEEIDDGSVVTEQATLEENQVLTVQVKNFKNLTPEEKVRIDETLKGFSFALSDFEMIRITDGTSGMEITETEEGAIDVSMIGEPTKRREQQPVTRDYAGGDVPFAVIEEAPIFPGCAGLSSNEARKACMSQKITEFINSDFDTSLGKELGLEGMNRIYVQFRIEKDGTITVLGARAPHEALEEEAVRVVNSLPKMEPGKQNGENVGVLYSLPITFMVNN